MSDSCGFYYPMAMYSSGANYGIILLIKFQLKCVKFMSEPGVKSYPKWLTFHI